MRATDHKTAAGITLKIASIAEQISLLSEALHTLCLYATASEKCALDIQYAVVEALNNVVVHAYHNQPDHEITVCWHQDKRTVRIDIIDNGLSLSCLPEPTLPPYDAEGGRGWWIINSCVDEYYYKVMAMVERERRLTPGGGEASDEVGLMASHTNILTLIKRF
jgi:serine/threonine-protein kinase RsbW